MTVNSDDFDIMQMCRACPHNRGEHDEQGCKYCSCTAFADTNADREALAVASDPVPVPTELRKPLRVVGEPPSDWLREPDDEPPTRDAVPRPQGIPTMGDLANTLRVWKTVGVSRAAVEYALDQVFHETVLVTDDPEPPVPSLDDQVAGLAQPTTSKRARLICANAAALVDGDRNAAYGDATDNFDQTGALWAVVFGHPVSAEQVAICMSLLKVARLLTDVTNEDSWTDGVGYLALGGGIANAPGRHRKP